MMSDWIGIPEGYVGPQLSFDPVARLVVVELHSKSFGKDFLPRRLFVRHADQNEYRQVINWGSELSSESAIFAGNGVLAAFNSVRYTRIEENHAAADWNGLYLWDLRSSSVLSCASPKTLILPAGISRGWVTDLLAFSPDHAHIYATIGLQKNERVRYHIAALNLATGAVELITELKSTFY